MKTKDLLILASMAVVLFSCENGSNSNSDDLANKIQYYPVQEEHGQKWGLLGTNGELLLSEEYNSEPSVVINGLYSVKTGDGTYSLFEASAKPKEIMEGLMAVGYLNDGLVPIARKSERIAVVDKNGQTVFTLEPVSGKEIIKSNPFFSEGILIAQTEENNFGAFNTKGEKIIDFKYTALNNFHDGVAIATKIVGENESKTIAIDTKGNELDNIKFKDGYTVLYPSFTDGYIAVKDKEGSFRFINKEGEEIKLPGKVKAIAMWNKKYFVFKGDDGWGVMTLNDAADIIIRAKYSSIQLLPDDKFYAVDNKDHYILNKEGDKELELSDDYKTFTVINNAKFKFIATEKSHYVLLDEQGKPINKMEFANLITSLNDNNIVSNYFDVAGMVQNLTANITDNGIGQYYIGESATELGLDPNKYQYTTRFQNDELNSKGYKYSISFSGSTNNTLAIGDYDFNTSSYILKLNPDAIVDNLSVSASCEQSCWNEAKSKVYEALKNKGYKAEAEGASNGVFTKGNVIAMVNSFGSNITISLQEYDQQTLDYLVNKYKQDTQQRQEDNNNYNESAQSTQSNNNDEEDW